MWRPQIPFFQGRTLCVVMANIQNETCVAITSIRVSLLWSKIPQAMTHEVLNNVATLSDGFYLHVVA